MNNLVIGVFPTRSLAEEAIAKLSDAGYSSNDISLILRENVIGGDNGKNQTESVAEGATTGATTGGILGGLAGLLIGIGVITVPGIGALLIGGPIAAALGLTGAAATAVSGAVTGVLAGGLVGGLVKLGVPREEALVFEQKVKEGAILVATSARSGEEEEVSDILSSCGAEEVSAIPLQTRLDR